MTAAPITAPITAPTGAPTTAPPPATRRHDIDALRAIAFAALILYHWGMLYVAGEDWGWHLKSAYHAQWLQLPMIAMNRWRMDLIFLISGLSVHFLLRDTRIGRFIALRSWRLLLPLIFGMGGYSAGYYAYIWSEVLDADSVEWMKQHGGLKRENGDHFRDTLLSRGGTKDALDLFRDFAGRDPDIQPLLKRRGLDGAADDAKAPPKDANK